MPTTLARPRRNRQRYGYVLALTLGFACLPLFAHAALVNINTASASELDALPGIGATKAQAIVDYRTQHGAFAAIADLQEVSGIGPSTFANIASLITVGAAPAADTDAAPPPAQAPDTGTAEHATTSAEEALSVTISADPIAYLHVPETFTAAVTTRSARTDPSTELAWNFGDASTNTGNPVAHTYRYPGSYLVEARAVAGTSAAEGSFTVTVTTLSPSIRAVTEEGVTIENTASTTLDLSGWRLTALGGNFRFPEDTRILPGTAVLFPQSTTGLPVALADTRLLYPDGMLAAVSALDSPGETKPTPDVVGSKEVKTVDVRVTTSQSPTYEKTAVTAPREPMSTSSSRGAVSATAPGGSPLSADALAALPGSTVHSLVRSPWTYGFLGILTVVGGAFLIL